MLVGYGQMGGIAFDPQTAGDAPYLRRQPPQVVNLPGALGNGTITYPVGGFYWERPRSLSVLLTTDSNAANRVPVLAYVDQDGIPFAQFPAAFLAVASKTSRFTWVRGVQAGGSASAAQIVSPLEPLLLTPGWSLTVTVTGGLVGDTLTLGRLYVERFETGPGLD